LEQNDMSVKSKLLLAFYGDDFTGSTDALEFLTRNGIKTMLFIEPPSPRQLEKHPELQAIGVAGMTRAMSAPAMEQTLSQAFTSLKTLNTKHVHYKVCSTFDSSPQVGSIGKAIDVGAGIFRNKWIPLLVGAPILGRYCTFGNLFARMGIGSTGAIHRLDRHPSMSKHPVTPATESDLCLHLSKQTSKRTGLIDVLDIALPVKEIKEKIKDLNNSGHEIVLFDVLNEEQLPVIGEILDNAAQEGTLFSVGSSGIEMALGSYWQKQDLAHATEEWETVNKPLAILAISGSCSPVTSSQIKWAAANGFAEVGLDTQNLTEKHIADVIITAIDFINKGKSVIVHTSIGSDDPRVEHTRQQLAGQGLQTAAVLGTALGKIAKQVVIDTAIKRVLIAGGDTSSYAARAMEIEAVEMICPLAPGAPLCRAYSSNKLIDGLEVNFKGGQVGAGDYFGMVLNMGVK